MEVVLLRHASVPTPYTTHLFIEPSQERVCGRLDRFQSATVMIQFVRKLCPRHDHEPEIVCSA